VGMQGQFSGDHCGPETDHAMPFGSENNPGADEATLCPVNRKSWAGL
jgi:hypothetical protein